MTPKYASIIKLCSTCKDANDAFSLSEAMRLKGFFLRVTDYSYQSNTPPKYEAYFLDTNDPEVEGRHESGFVAQAISIAAMRVLRNKAKQLEKEQAKKKVEKNVKKNK